MRKWTVHEPGGRSVGVRAASWVVALGLGLEAMGSAADLTRLACEVLPQDKVIARDATAGRTWIVAEVQQAEAPEVQRGGPVMALAGFALR